MDTEYINSSKKEFLILIPAYNVEKTISRVIENIREQLKQCDILVIDDGSSDATLEVLKNLNIKRLLKV